MANKKRIGDVWGQSPDLEHTNKYRDPVTGLLIYEVCGKKFQETAPIESVIECLVNFYDRYGERAKLAEKNEGIDHKALMHAIRAAGQLIELFEHGTITFPRPNAEYLEKVKSGVLDYRNEIEPALNDLMDKVELLGNESTLPLKSDIKFWDNFLLDTCKKQIINQLNWTLIR